MITQRIGRLSVLSRMFVTVAGLLTMAATLSPTPAQAVPLFARQTGQNCMACHAGGQFPELTQYGRLFKMTGYTMGERTSMPISAMAMVSRSQVSNTSKSDNPSQDFQKNRDISVPNASIFLGGKITDNFGAFAQITYDNYGTPNDGVGYQGRTAMDNVDLRYADRFIDANRDLILGVSLNNNPSVSDPWNTAPAWMQYVPVPSPTSSQFIDGNAPYPSYASGGNIAGLTAYAYWNQTIYAELGAYRTSSNLFRFMSTGISDTDKTKLKGINPYLRLAYTHQMGPHYWMVGGSRMDTTLPNDPSPDYFEDTGLDAQYQYLLDPHSVTVQLAYMHERHRYPDGTSDSGPGFVGAANNSAVDSTDITRAKATYVYRATYGGSLSLFNKTGSTNTFNQTSGYDPDTLAITSDPNATAASTRVSGNLSGNPGTTGATYEAFWMPIQYVRLGLQYTNYTRYNGAHSNYDGFGRNASDNNSLFLYLWAAY